MRCMSVLLGTLALFSCATPEAPTPVDPNLIAYDGRTAVEWAGVLNDAPRLADDGESAALLQAAINAFAVMGGDALEALRPLLASESDVTRFSAASAITRIGEPAFPAAPDLIPLIEDRANPQLRVAGLRALEAIGSLAKDQRESAAELLRDPYPEVRIAAIRAVAAIRPIGSSDQIHALIHKIAVSDFDASVRFAAKNALGVDRYQLPARESPVRR